MSNDTPSITDIRAGNGRNLIVTWKGGAESVVDVVQFLSGYEIFAPLCADDDLFHEVKPGKWGWCSHWSDEMEISADALRRLAVEQGGAWLRDWRTAHHLTQAEAAGALGVSARMWRQYEAGSQLLPKTVRLAGIGLDARGKAA